MTAFTRLDILRMICLVLVGVGVALGQTSDATRDVALGFQIDTAHTGATISPGLKPPLTVKWSVNLPGLASYPIVAGGMVFVIEDGNPSTLYALDAQTGQAAWTQPVPGGLGIWVGTAYENGVLFAVQTENPDVQAGYMFAYSASNGQQLWSTDLTGQPFFETGLTASNGIVYTSGTGADGSVYAVRETDGAILWTGHVLFGQNSVPAVTGGGVYVSYACPQTYLFNATTGAQEWLYSGECDGGGGDSVAVYQGLVYVRDIVAYSTDGITLNASDGTLAGGLNSQYSPAFWENKVIYTEPASLSAVDLSTGRGTWTLAPHSGETFSCAPIIVNGVVYAGTSAGNLYGYSVRNGASVYSTNLGQAISCDEAFPYPLAGMSAGMGILVVPAGTAVVALQ